MKLRHGFSQLSEVGLHTVEAGEGPLLLLLHGFPDFWYTWRKQLEVLGRSFRVVAPDLRGYNQSDKPASVKAYRMDRLARDVAELIEDLGEQSALVAGHDWGGAVAWATAGFFPERVRRLAVLNCPHPNAMSHALRRNPRQLARSWYILGFQLRGLPEWILRRRLAAWLRYAYGDLLTSQDLKRHLEALRRPAALTSAIHYYRAGAVQVPPTRCPALLLFGTGDRFLLRSTAADSARHVETPLRIEWLEGVGHWVHLEATDEVNRTLLEWFGADSTSEG
ncbi:MAG: alpha/beta hydrolase [Candidatus Eremiobacterota bacterium]